jgi:limonene-1,2-epoxide hydrolase
MGDKAEATIRRFFEAWRRNDPDEIVSFFREDAVYTDGPRGTHRGSAAIREMVVNANKLTPGGFEVEVQSLVSDGTLVMVERIDRFQARGRTFAMDVAGAFEVDDHGLIFRWRDYFDLKEIQDRVGAG